jgi:Rrf2 family protein
VRGAQGGYKLARPAENYTVGAILRLIEGSLAPVACLENTPNQCSRCGECEALGLWTQLDEVIGGVVDRVTLAELASKRGPGADPPAAG